MIETILTFVWGAGVVGSIHPIYSALLRHTTRGKSKPVLTGTAAAATFGALFWPVAIPFMASYYLHTGRLFNGIEDIVEAKETVVNENLSVASRAAAALEVQKAATEIESETNKAAKRADADRIKAREQADGHADDVQYLWGRMYDAEYGTAKKLAYEELHADASARDYERKAAKKRAAQERRAEVVEVEVPSGHGPAYDAALMRQFGIRLHDEAGDGKS